jgi:hypothetical protein
MAQDLPNKRGEWQPDPKGQHHWRKVYAPFRRGGMEIDFLFTDLNPNTWTSLVAKLIEIKIKFTVTTQRFRPRIKFDP